MAFLLDADGCTQMDAPYWATLCIYLVLHVAVSLGEMLLFDVLSLQRSYMYVQAVHDHETKSYVEAH